MTREGNMPGNPHECRVKPPQCSKLAQNAITSECDAFFALADTWKRLAAELEADQMLLQALSELHLTSQPYEALLRALNIHPGLNGLCQRSQRRTCQSPTGAMTAKSRANFRCA
jgi:hypothetical protein